MTLSECLSSSWRGIIADRIEPYCTYERSVHIGASSTNLYILSPFFRSAAEGNSDHDVVTCTRRIHRASSSRSCSVGCGVCQPNQTKPNQTAKCDHNGAPNSKPSFLSSWPKWRLAPIFPLMSAWFIAIPSTIPIQCYANELAFFELNSPLSVTRSPRENDWYELTAQSFSRSVGRFCSAFVGEGKAFR